MAISNLNVVVSTSLAGAGVAAAAAPGGAAVLACTLSERALVVRAPVSERCWAVRVTRHTGVRCAPGQWKKPVLIKSAANARRCPKTPPPPNSRRLRP